MSSTFKRRVTGATAAVATTAGDAHGSTIGSTAEPHREQSLNQPALLLGLKGTKPWTAGLTFTSTGLHDLDSILGGGQPIGTCLWIEEDRWMGSFATVLAQYWCAEAILQEHHLIIPVPTTNETDESNDLLDWRSSSSYNDNDENEVTTQTSCTMEQVQNILLRGLPRCLNQGIDGALENDSHTMPLNTLTEEGEEDNDNDDGSNDDNDNKRNKVKEEGGAQSKEASPDDEGLTIAWQYRTSIQQERSGHVQHHPKLKPATVPAFRNIYCHSYDLEHQLQDQLDVSSSCHIPVIPAIGNATTLYRTLLKETTNKLEQARKVTRLVLYHPDPTTLPSLLTFLLSYIRTHHLPVVILVVCRSWTMSQIQLSAGRRVADMVFSVESFTSRMEYPPPNEFRLFQGLLHVHKISTAPITGQLVEHTAVKRLPSPIYGLKRDRRKLHVELLHIPPEDFATGGGSVSTGERAGAGRASGGCASSLGGHVSLDF